MYGQIPTAGSITMKKLEAFVAVAHTQNFGRAGELLNRSQPTVSVQVESLESDTNTRLFVRNTRNVELTEAGALFLKRAQNALTEVELGLSEVARFLRDKTNNIRITSAPTISNHLLPSILQSFHAIYPNVEIVLREAVYDAMRIDLLDGQSDLGIGPQVAPIAGVRQTPIFTDEIVAILPKATGSKVKNPCNIEELSEFPVLVSKPATALRHLLDSAFKDAGASPTYVSEVFHTETLIGMVRAGLAITFVPYYVARSNWRDDYDIFRLNPQISRQVCIFRPEDTVASEIVDRLDDLIQEKMPKIVEDTCN